MSDLDLAALGFVASNRASLAKWLILLTWDVDHVANAQMLMTFRVVLTLHHQYDLPGNGTPPPQREWMALLIIENAYNCKRFPLQLELSGLARIS